mgnify:CR=1 FL=1
MSFSRKGDDVLDLVRFYLFNEVADIGPGNKGLAGPALDNGLDSGVFFSLAKAFIQLGDDRFVERIHGLRTMEGDGGNVVFYFKIYKSEVKGFAEFFLASQNLRHFKIRIFLGDSLNRCKGFINTNFIDNLEWAEHPAQADLGTSIGIFNGGNPFIDHLPEDRCVHAPTFTQDMLVANEHDSRLAAD